MFVKQSKPSDSNELCTMLKKMESPIVLINCTSEKLTTSFFDPLSINASLVDSRRSAPRLLIYPLGIMTEMSLSDLNDREKLLTVCRILLVYISGLFYFFDEYFFCTVRCF